MSDNTNLIFRGNLGFLSTYNLEDIYFHLGEKQINEKINQFKENASMGIRLEEIVYGENKKGYYDKGPIDCLSLFLNWFTDSQTLEYLFKKVNSYSEATYMTNSLWSVYRIGIINKLISSFNEEDDLYKQLKMNLNYNYYYIDYHFFLISLYRILLVSNDIELASKIHSTTLIEYLPKIDKVKSSLIDLDIWGASGLGNGVLSALQRFCEETNQTEQYNQVFENALDEGWRF